MLDRSVHRARLVSSVAATVISLACGTNYVYSAWAPQFADKLRLSATQSNLIGLAGNLGMYSMGVPVGVMVDQKGPRPAVLGAVVLLGFGYLPFKASYDSGTGSVPWLCFFSYLTGLGGCMAFAAAVKTSALNWPYHKGTATAFPLAAFGLSAFFFSLVGAGLFPGDTSAFLSLLNFGTFGMTLGGFFFLRVLPPGHLHMSYQPLSGGHSNVPRKSEDGYRCGVQSEEIDGAATPSTSRAANTSGEAAVAAHLPAQSLFPEALSSSPPPGELEHGVGETSLMNSASSLRGDVLVQNSVDLDRSCCIDIRGWQLLRNIEFWQLFLIMGILAGIGLMTINNIGNNANALWKRYDDSVSEEFLVKMQQLHVSILSAASFAGRLLSGTGSDLLVKVLKASRVWCVVLASFIFLLAQVCALNITNPHLLSFVSGLSGLGYGFLFGVYPSIVAESFGIHALSQNWGFMTLSPVLSGNVFNLFYGAVFDRHSIVGPDGERSCLDGLSCYWSAYLVTLGACGLGLLVTLAVIGYQYLERSKVQWKGIPD